ncbi:MAG: hypothetical protein AB7Q17_05565 [Phycisphaerae bacterium]
MVSLRRAADLALCCGLALTLGACDLVRRDPVAPQGPAIPEADTAFTGPTRPASPGDPTTPAVSPAALQRDVRLSVLHVQTPRDHRTRSAKIWAHLQETALDHDTTLRLRRNGLRVGIGRAAWWTAVCAELDAIDGRRVHELPTVKLVPGIPLGFELDESPREQTIFVVEPDGVLSGQTWPDSRNSLSATFRIDAKLADRVHVTIVPEVRQRLSGWRWVRTEAGMMQVPEEGGQQFTAAAFTLPLDPGQFGVIAPTENADLFGLIGSVFLTTEIEGRRYDSYVFVSVDVGTGDGDARRQ